LKTFKVHSLRSIHSIHSIHSIQSIHLSLYTKGFNPKLLIPSSFAHKCYFNQFTRSYVLQFLLFVRTFWTPYTLTLHILQSLNTIHKFPSFHKYKAPYVYTFAKLYTHHTLLSFTRIIRLLNLHASYVSYVFAKF
jgi:hypothetical protein